MVVAALPRLWKGLSSSCSETGGPERGTPSTTGNCAGAAYTGGRADAATAGGTDDG